MQVTITDAERTILVRMLSSAVGEVRSQVRRTHQPGWHDGLKQEESLIKGLLEKLDG